MLFWVWFGLVFGFGFGFDFGNKNKNKNKNKTIEKEKLPKIWWGVVDIKVKLERRSGSIITTN